MPTSAPASRASRASEASEAGRKYWCGMRMTSSLSPTCKSKPLPPRPKTPLSLPVSLYHSSTKSNSVQPNERRQSEIPEAVSTADRRARQLHPERTPSAHVHVHPIHTKLLACCQQYKDPSTVADNSGTEIRPASKSNQQQQNQPPTHLTHIRVENDLRAFAQR